MIRIDRFKAVFINVPKTGSTSVREFLVNNVVTDQDTVVYHSGFSSIQNLKGLNSHYTQHMSLVNNFCLPDDTFFATVRNPLERMLSLYLYRWRQGKVQSPSIQDFRQKLIDGEGWLIDHQPYQMQPQHEFLDYGEWWCFDHLDQHINDLVQRYNIEVKVPLQWHNKSLSPSKQTSDLIDNFYDDETRKLVSTVHARDFELYERVKDDYRASGN